MHHLLLQIGATKLHALLLEVDLHVLLLNKGLVGVGSMVLLPDFGKDESRFLAKGDDYLS
jgi:hypothetical protein